MELKVGLKAVQSGKRNRFLVFKLIAAYQMYQQTILNTKNEY